MSLIKINKHPQATAENATVKNERLHTNNLEELY